MLLLPKIDLALQSFYYFTLFPFIFSIFILFFILLNIYSKVNLWKFINFLISNRILWTKEPIRLRNAKLQLLNGQNKKS
jgi:hypothetical protein